MMVYFRERINMDYVKKINQKMVIVSITQPHIRPIVRGKAGKPVEFERGGCWGFPSISNHAVGAKLSVSCFDGEGCSWLKSISNRRVDNYVFLDHLSWDNFNESGDLQTQVEAYKNYTGYYPSSVHVDSEVYPLGQNLSNQSQ